MSDHERVAAHYRQGDVLGAIASGVARLGKTPETVAIEDLAPVDEFHIGGRRASEDFLNQLGLSGEHHVLDVGCGLGGTARFVADRYQSRVTGVDLTAEYIDAGKILCHWVGLDDRIALHQGSALSLTFGDNTFDGAYMMHVGMNIDNKARLFSEVFRVLRRGAWFGVYDVMRMAEGELIYPVPWAASPATSAVSSPAHYKEALRSAGFMVDRERNRQDFAIDFFRRIAKAGASKERPPLGPHILMGDTAPIKAKNMIENISTGLLAPVELIARKP